MTLIRVLVTGAQRKRRYWQARIALSKPYQKTEGKTGNVHT